MTKARMNTLIRILGVVAMVMAFLAISMVTGPSVAHAQASCGGTTDHVSANFDAAIPSTSNNSGNFNCIDGIGNQGAAVTELQNSMNFCRGEHLSVDGIYGSLTAAAMMRAQRALGVPADGVYGPQTRHAGFLFKGVTIQHPRIACGTAGF